MLQESKLTTTISELTQVKAEKAKAEAELDILSDKDLFLSLYLRYQLAKEKAAHGDGDAKIERKALDQYVAERVGRDKLILRKGGGRLATISFKDGTLWEIPRELHVAEAN